MRAVGGCSTTRSRKTFCRALPFNTFNPDQPSIRSGHHRFFFRFRPNRDPDGVPIFTTFSTPTSSLSTQSAHSVHTKLQLNFIRNCSEKACLKSVTSVRMHQLFRYRDINQPVNRAFPRRGLSTTARSRLTEERFFTSINSRPLLFQTTTHCKEFLRTRSQGFSHNVNYTGRIRSTTLLTVRICGECNAAGNSHCTKCEKGKLEFRQ